MDRFDILKYTILLEEYVKKQVIEKILYYGFENTFTNQESFQNWLIPVKRKLKKFEKKHSKMKEAIYHCTAKELINLFNLLNFDIRREIAKSTFFINVIGRVSKMNTVLTGNKLIRDTLAHPTLNVDKILNSMTTFTFLPEKYDTNLKRINYFYQIVKIIYNLFEW